ncbi:MBL fold metallo-hydrolase [Oscillibacter sp.]|uniref:MBL fold metallo-hydrolase n=1 Tax=Oscillibacter sp. TaxID=1945593 RepID=UPI00257EF2F1|nr:MBL fold metallo-hydrolase [Oscillibacter sp.]
MDCGSRNSWYDAGGIAADHLATMGCGTLDYLILTHYDYDHISGVAELLARARVDTLLLPDVSDDAGARFRWRWPPGTTAWTFNTWRRRRFTPWGRAASPSTRRGTWRATTNRGWPSCAPMATTTC